jgi:hypothetical protein
VLIAALLVAVAAEVGRAARFLPDTSPEFAEWRGYVADSRETACPFTLSVGGAYAFDAERVVMFGEIRGGGPGAYRSFLLRSIDGGRTWQETLTPVLRSEVIEVSFVSEREGFALVGWVVEGPGTLRLYHTGDGAAKWNFVSEVPKPHNLDVPIAFACSSSRRCQLDLECVYSEGAGHAVTTSDGGHNWRARASAPRQVTRPYGNAHAKAADGTDWNFRESDDSEYILVTKAPSSGRGATDIAALARNYSLDSKGYLVVCER